MLALVPLHASLLPSLVPRHGAVLMQGPGYKGQGPTAVQGATYQGPGMSTAPIVMSGGCSKYLMHVIDPAANKASHRVKWCLPHAPNADERMAGPV